MRTAVLIALSVAIAACSSPRTATEPVVYSQAEAADSITVRVGRTIAVDDIRIRFDAVESDSRCATDVVCVWAGDAVASLVVERTAVPSSGISLKLHTGLDPRNGTAHGFRIELIGLQPSPVSSSPIRAGDYVASLRVLRTS